MIVHTKAFGRYRKLSQAHLDFVVLVCHLAPAFRAGLLDNQLAAALYQPDYFKANTKEQLLGFASNYKSELSRSTLIAIFSYFESYVREVLKEIIEFHGGRAKIKTLAMSRARSSLDRSPRDVEKYKRKIQDYGRKKKDRPKFEKYSRLLDKEGFRFPTELLAYYGVIQLITKTDARRGMRAWEIPDILEDAFLYRISSVDRQQLDRLRDLRNKIAHGTAPSVTLEASARAASELHTLAAKVDKHIADHFFVLQRFL
jgi:hypothetical protein